MNHLVKTLTAVALLVLASGVAAAGAPADVAEQMAGMNQMCAETADARAQRQTENPLYNRLGGYDKIHEFTTEVVRLHNENDAIRHMFAHVDSVNLAKHVADFVSAGTGGTAEYTGRDMVSAHKHLELTDADFLSAGGDIVKAMKSMEYGENEINEIICILVSMKDQVVLK
jgi:hemoglobin